jgi:hypothetical protein
VEQRIPIPVTVPDRQPIEGQLNVVHDVLAAKRAYGDKPPKLGPAIMAARREQLLDNAAALDDKLVDVAVAAMHTMEQLRRAMPELTVRRDA